MAMPPDYVPNGTRKIRANGERPVGGFTRGNRNSTYLGRDLTRGLAAKVGNPVGAPDPVFFRPKPKSAETVLRERVERRIERAKPCPGCGMKCDVPRTCFCWGEDSPTRLGAY